MRVLATPEPHLNKGLHGIYCLMMFIFYTPATRVEAGVERWLTNIPGDRLTTSKMINLRAIE